MNDSVLYALLGCLPPSSKKFSILGDTVFWPDGIRDLLLIVELLTFHVVYIQSTDQYLQEVHRCVYRCVNETDITPVTK